MHSGENPAVPARDYLTKLNAQLYFDDAAAIMARLKPERPLVFLHEYFKNVLEMEHTIGRDFEYINSSSRNRGSFLPACHQAFGHFDDETELVIGDLYQLVLLICPTFPEGRVLEIPRLLREDPDAQIPVGTLRTAFFVHFSFYDHLLELKKLFVQPGLGGAPPEWKLVTLIEVLRFVEEIDAPTQRSQGVTIPATSVTRAFRSDAELNFGDFVFRLLGDRTLAFALPEDATANSAAWLPRSECEAVASLFVTRNSRGAAGSEEEDRFGKAAKSKSKDKPKASSRKK